MNVEVNVCGGGGWGGDLGRALVKGYNCVELCVSSVKKKFSSRSAQYPRCSYIISTRVNANAGRDIGDENCYVRFTLIWYTISNFT